MDGLSNKNGDAELPDIENLFQNTNDLCNPITSLSKTKPLYSLEPWLTYQITNFLPHGRTVLHSLQQIIIIDVPINFDLTRSPYHHCWSLPGFLPTP